MPGNGRKLVYYCAVSADGFIARVDGSVDWLESREAADYGIEEFMHGVDTIVWGRTTYEQYGMKPPGLEPFGDVRHLVLSRRPPPEGADPRAEFTKESPKELARRLRAQDDGKDVWLMGGGMSAGSFLDAGELDELFVHVIPVLLGTGVPLFGPKPRTVALELNETKAFADGVVRLRYAVRRGSVAR